MQTSPPRPVQVRRSKQSKVKNMLGEELHVAKAKLDIDLNGIIDQRTKTNVSQINLKVIKKSQDDYMG